MRCGPAALRPWAALGGSSDREHKAKPLRRPTPPPRWQSGLPGPLDLKYLLLVTLPFNIAGAVRVRMWMQDPCSMHLVMVRKLVPYM